MTSADIHSLRLINDEFAAAVRSLDARAALAADERFHRAAAPDRGRERC